MTGREYKEYAMRTNDHGSHLRLAARMMEDNGIDVAAVIEGYTGMLGEAGEFTEVIKKWLFQGHDLDEDHAKRELGDVMWYIAMLCEAFDWSLDEIMQMNLDKLEERYPEIFTEELSEQRKEGDR